MERIDATRVAETLLAAPGWARVGLTAPKHHLRIEAAHELARAIIAEVVGTDSLEHGPDQFRLSL